MTLYGGIDLHSNNMVVILINEGQNVINQKSFKNDSDRLLHWLEPYRSQIGCLAIESTFNWYWLVDQLQQADYPVKLAHPLAMRQYCGLKYTNDHTDAFWLAKQLRLGILPEGYIYPYEQRGLRELMRTRMKVKQRHIQLVNQLKSAIHRYSGYRLTVNQLARLTSSDLATYLPDDYSAASCRSFHRQMLDHANELKSLEDQAKQALQKDDTFQRLLGVPGVGDILALVIQLETGSISRFPNAGHYSSYCRCVKSDKFSNGQKKGTNNDKNGNGYLAWAMMEAASGAIRHYQPINSYYQRQANKKSRQVAWKIVARKLSQAIYLMLKNEEEFDMERSFF